MAFRRKAVIRRKRVFKKRIVRKSRISQAVKKYVKTTIHKQIENKCVQINQGSSFGNINESPDFNAFPMCPLTGYWTIAQGVGQGNRVGNSIKVRKAHLNYIIRPTPYDASVNVNPRPCEVQLMLGYVKNTPCTIPNSIDISNLFQSGNGGVAPNGSTRDIISIINKDYWNIKKRWTHKIGYANANGTGTLAGSQSFANNDFKLNVVKRMDITKLLPASCTFNDTTNITSGKNLFFMYYAVSCDAIVYNATTLPTNIEYWLDFEYEDA